MAFGEGWDVPVGANPWSDFHWFHVSPRSALVVVVLSEDVVWYSGHFVDGRMAPCLGKGCELCGAGTGGQVRYVLPVVEISTRRVGLMEVSQSIGQLIRSWVDRRGELRGMTLEFTKATHAKQSRTNVGYVDAECAPWYRSCRVPDVKTALVLTWKKAGFDVPEGMAGG